jgi:hypothetical protein
VSYINKGGENGKVIAPGLPDSSSLYYRMALPLEHEDHMPPNQKPQPSSAEMALIQSWIQEGAHFKMKIHEFRDAAKVRSYFSSLVAQSEIELLIPIEEVEPADDNLLVELRRQGVMALPVASQSNFLSVSFVNKKTVSDDDMRLLLPLKKQIVWLDLAYTNAGDTCLAVLTELSALRKLNLQYTAVTNTGMSSVAKLSNLVYLNLVGTSVTDDGVQDLAALEQLKNLYLFQTAVSHVGIKNLTSAAPGIAIDTGGYKLPVSAEDSADVFSSP